MSWDERDFGRVAVVPDGVLPPGGDARLAAPTLVVVAWLPPSQRRQRRLERLVRIELNRASVPAGSVLVLANAEMPAAERVRTPIAHLGPARLGALVDESAELRLRMPSLLGIRGFEVLAAPEILERSTVDIAAARELAPVFVPTAAYERSVAVLRRHHFAVLTGPPEMGKTAIARMIALARLTAGWEAHECTRPEELWAAFASDRAQVFVADDAFGSTEYRPDAADRWALELDRVLRAMDDRHWLIWTSRPAPLKAGLGRVQREHGVEHFPQPAEIQVDAAALAIDEKALILFRHAKAAALPKFAVRLVQTHGWTIVSHPHFTPERIRRFVAERLLVLATGEAPQKGVAAAVAAEIREPTTAMAASFAALAPEHRAVLLALLDAPPEPVPERELTAAVRRHSDTGLTRAPRELVDRMTDHFVRLVPPSSIAWVHPSWRDLVITELAGDRTGRLRFLERCSLEGVLLALSVAGGVSGERVLPLLHEDADWDAVAGRVTYLVPALDDASAVRLLESLRTALEAALPDRKGAEAVAISALALDALAAKWSERKTVPVAALEAWFAVAALLPEPRPAPRVGGTWIELVPTEPIDIGSRPDLNRFEDWLALVETLRVFASDELERFGFPERQDRIVAAFIADAAARPSDETEELATRILQRIRRLFPTYGAEAALATHTLSATPEPWFEVRFETHPRRPEPTRSDRAVVERVLRDLG